MMSTAERAPGLISDIITLTLVDSTLMNEFVCKLGDNCYLFTHLLELVTSKYYKVHNLYLMYCLRFSLNA